MIFMKIQEYAMIYIHHLPPTKMEKVKKCQKSKKLNDMYIYTPFATSENEENQENAGFPENAIICIYTICDVPKWKKSRKR